MVWKESITLCERTLQLETGRIARQAHGAVLLREGNTVILATVVYRPPGEEKMTFFPLTVDYREYLSAAGRIPGGFLKRDAWQTDDKILGGRLCDRSIRPLFPKAFQAETQVQTTVMSYDPSSDPTVLAITAAAAAIGISEIPWQGPLAAVRVVRSEAGLVAFPDPKQRAASSLDLVLSVSREGVVMLEGSAKQATDEELLEAIAFGQEALTPLLDLLQTMTEAVGKTKLELPPPSIPGPLADTLREAALEPLRQALSIPEKLPRHAALKATKAEVLATVQSNHAAPEGERLGEQLADWGPNILDELEQRLLREAIVYEHRRPDGRSPTEIRPIDCEVGWLPATHGSALFTRGETQAMVSLTLGSKQDRLLVESLDGMRQERFMLNYGFPSYSVGEARPMRAPGRREIGHGNLARRALEPVLPPSNSFPYTLRVVSEISESNGSSSMATVCGSTLALMDGGVPLIAPVAGISMGMIREEEHLIVLSDILGYEDYLGDMDFKVAGTAEGITAIQMDNKIGSLPAEVMARALEQARQGRILILGEMAKALAEPRPQTKPHVPLRDSVTIAPNRVRNLIGPSGRTIKELQSRTNARIEVDENRVHIYAPNRDALDAARQEVLDLAGPLQILQVDEVYDGVVTGVREFGAFVKIRGQEGLVHISEWAGQRVENMATVAKSGDAVRVRVLAPDRRGRLSLSRKAAL